MLAPESKVSSRTLNRFVAPAMVLLRILADGSMVTWGRTDISDTRSLLAFLGFATVGGSPSCVCDKSRVQDLFPNAFHKEIKQNFGGDSSRV